MIMIRVMKPGKRGWEVGGWGWGGGGGRFQSIEQLGT